MTAALTCEGVTAGYGKLPVVRDFNLEVQQGEIVGLLGPNGAGKSTLLMTIAGLLPLLSGAIRKNGKLLPRAAPYKVNRGGIVLVPDDRALFTGLTTRQNLELACRAGRSKVSDILELFPGLGKRLNVPAGALSGGEQQMLAVGRGLIQSPDVLLIDEMSMGLAPVIVTDLLHRLRAVAEERHTAVVLVEQHVDLALDIVDRALVLEHGEVKLEGAAVTLRQDRSRVERAYFGTSTEETEALT